MEHSPTSRTAVDSQAAGTLRKLLAIDTCGSSGGVGLVMVPSDEGKPTLLDERTLPGRQTQEQLLPAMDDLLQSNGWHACDLYAVGAVTGPGSFTGVRVGLAAAKGLAVALGIPLVGVSRLAVLAAQAGAIYAEAWIAAGRGDIFRGRYRDGHCLDEVMLRQAAATADLTADGAVLMEEDLLAQSPLLRLVPPVGIREAVPLIAQQVQRGILVDAALLQANYLRVPDAELARCERSSQSRPPV